MSAGTTTEEVFQTHGRTPERYMEDLADAIEKRLGPAEVDTDAFMVQAADALARAPHGQDLPAGVRAHLGLAEYAFMRSDQGNVLEHSEAALDLARRIKDTQLLRRALSIRASMLGESVAFGEAMETFADAVDTAKSTGDARQQAVVWHNLANTLNALGAYNDAYDMSRLTLKLLGRFDTSERRLHWSAQSIMATALFHMQEPSRSLQVIRQGLERMPEPRDASEYLAATELHQQYVYVLLEVESISRAEEHAQRAAALADQCGYPRAKIAADLAGAMVSVHQGRVRDGMSMLEDCLSRSYKLGPSAVRESLWALVKAHEAVGDRKMVASYLGQLVDSLLNTARDAVQTRLDHQRVVDGQEREAWLRRCLLELAISAGLRDDPTGAHGVRVGYLADLMGRDLGLDSDTCELLRLAGALHDIGKLVMPQAILLKRGALSEEERTVVRRHAVLGEQLLSTFQMAGLDTVAGVARSHHERWDGLGYPDQLAGEAIPLSARIVSVAEVFDTLVFPRPYKNAWPVSEALTEIRHLAGVHFDPKIVDALERVVAKFQAEHGDVMELTNVAADGSGFVTGRARVMRALREAVYQ